MSDETYDLNKEQYETMPTSEEVRDKAMATAHGLGGNTQMLASVRAAAAEAQAQQQIRSDAKQLAEQGAGLRNAPPAPACPQLRRHRHRPARQTSDRPRTVLDRHRTQSLRGDHSCPARTEPDDLHTRR